MYPVVFFDALRVKIREDAVVRNKAIYLALGVLPDGTRDILGLWIENTEGAKFWMKVFNDLKTRGVADILTAVTDGLKGMPEGLTAVFPATTLQTCIVHLIRNSLDYASWKERKALATAIKPIYQVAQKLRDAFGYSLLTMREFLPHSLCRPSKPDFSRFLSLFEVCSSPFGNQRADCALCRRQSPAE